MTSRPELDDVPPLHALGRRPLLTVTILLAGAGLGIMLPLLRAPTPTATVLVLLDARSAPGAIPDDHSGGRAAREQAALADLPVVRASAAQAVLAAHPGLGMSATRLAEGLRVTIPRGTASVAISFSAPSREAARDGAEAASRTYVALRTRHVRQEVGGLLRRLDRLDRELARQGAAPGGDARREVLRRRSEALLVRVAPGRGINAVVTGREERETVRGPLARGLAGLLSALFPALVVGYRADARRRLHRVPTDARAVLSAPLLGAVTGWRHRAGRERDDASEPAAQGFALVASALLARLDADARPRPVVALVDAFRSGPPGGAALADLALAMADQGRRVLAVTDNSTAVELLREGRARRTAIDRRRSGDVGVLSPTALWHELTGWDVVVLGTPGVHRGGRALRFAPRADQLVVVVPHRAPVTRLVGLRRRLVALHVPCLGYVYLDRRRARTGSADRAALRPSAVLRVAA